MKTTARSFDIINNTLRSLSLAQSLLKFRKTPIWRIGNRGVDVELPPLCRGWKFPLGTHDLSRNSTYILTFGTELSVRFPLVVFVSGWVPEYFLRGAAAEHVNMMVEEKRLCPGEPLREGGSFFPRLSPQNSHRVRLASVDFSTYHKQASIRFETGHRRVVDNFR